MRQTEKQFYTKHAFFHFLLFHQPWPAADTVVTFACDNVTSLWAMLQ